jgi:hypothetical protein
MIMFTGRIVNKVRMVKFGNRETVNMFHGIANGRLDELISQDDCISLLNKLVSEAIFSNFDLQNLGNSVWAFANLKTYHQNLVVNVSQQCVARRFVQFNSQ